jgi:hypothetical protein
MAQTDEPAHERATEHIERELYWAEEETPRARMNTQQVRDSLHDFAAMMRADQTQMIPRGEPNLAARTVWKRRLKLRLFRLMRPVSWRYDRLLAEHAELSTALAERLQAAEAEIERLKRDPNP